MLFIPRPGFKKFRRSAGFTIMEVMIVVSISALIMGGIVSMQMISARAIKEIYGPTRSRSERMMALNALRFKLSDAKMGSCVVSDNNHRIRFRDPSQAPGVISEFYFSTSLKKLFYTADVSDGNKELKARGPIDITFTLGTTDLDPLQHQVYNGTGSAVTLFVLTSADLAYSRVDTRDGETVVYMRNP